MSWISRSLDVIFGCKIAFTATAVFTTTVSYRTYFIRMSRLKLATEILRINSRSRFWKYTEFCMSKICECNFILLTIRYKILPSLNVKTSQTNSTSRMVDANNMSARSSAWFHAFMPTGWLPNYYNTIQTLNTLANRNVTSYDLKIFRVF